MSEMVEESYQILPSKEKMHAVSCRWKWREVGSQSGHPCQILSALKPQLPCSRVFIGPHRLYVSLGPA